MARLLPLLLLVACSGVSPTFSDGSVPDSGRFGPDSSTADAGSAYDEGLKPAGDASELDSSVPDAGPEIDEGTDAYVAPPVDAGPPPCVTHVSTPLYLCPGEPDPANRCCDMPCTPTGRCLGSVSANFCACDRSITYCPPGDPDTTCTYFGMVCDCSF